MKLKDLFTEEELKDIKKNEHILGLPDDETIEYNIKKHYMDLTLEQYIEIRKLEELQNIKEQIKETFYY